MEVYKEKAKQFYNEKHNDIFMFDKGKILFLDEVAEPVGYYPLKVDINNNMKAGSVIVDILTTINENRDRLECLKPNTFQGALFLMLAHTATLARNNSDTPINLSSCLSHFKVFGYDNSKYNRQMEANPRIVDAEAYGLPSNLQDFRTLSEHFKVVVRGNSPVSNIPPLGKK